MALYFIGVNRDSKRGKKLKPLLYDNSERNEKVQAIVGDYELSQPVLNVQIQKAQLRAIATSAYQKFKDMQYQLDLEGICTEITGVVDQKLEDVVYAKRLDEEMKRIFNEKVQAENYMASVLFTKEEALPIQLSARLNTEQVVALFQSGAYRRDDFDDVFNQSFKDQMLRLVGNEPIVSQFMLADVDVFRNEQIGQIFSGLCLNRFTKGQYIISESEKADFSMYAQTDFSHVFVDRLQKTCAALGEEVRDFNALLPTMSDVTQAQEAIDRELGSEQVTFIDDDPTLAVLQQKDDDAVVSKPTIDLDDNDLAQALGQDSFDVGDALGADDLDLQLSLDDSDYESEESPLDVFDDDDLDGYFSDIDRLVANQNAANATMEENDDDFGL